MATIDDLLAIEGQEELWEFLDRDALVLTKRIAKATQRAEMNDSAKQFLEEVGACTDISFAGVYINSALNTAAEFRDGVISYVEVDSVDPDIFSTASPQIDDADGLSRLVAPLQFKENEPFGVVVFERPDFSSRDIALLRDATFNLTTHINNIAEKTELRRLVVRDPLTDLYNRRRLNSDYASYVRNWVNSGQNFGLIFADLDLFKEINTHYGHVYGDYILKTVAQIVIDSTDSTSMVYRFGGEEFIIILPGASPLQTEEVARLIGDNIREHQFEQSADCENFLRPSPRITLSMGSVSTEEEYLDDRRIINVANRRMLEAKGYGRDAVVSNIRLDIQTGIAGMPSFKPHLRDRINQCNKPALEDEPAGNIALLVYDVVRFKELRDRIGKQASYDAFKDVVRWFYGEHSNFDFVARPFNYDDIIATLFTEPPVKDFDVQVTDIAASYLHKLRNLSLDNGHGRLNIDFAVGGVIYDPSMLAPDQLVRNPDVLFGYAENIVAEAGKMDERIKIEYFNPSSQSYQDLASQRQDHPSRQTELF
ncbi:diguanylate cyclase [Nanoarchaeota archaeon]